MGIFKQIAEYLYLKKRDPNEERTQFMKMMDGMNRLSIFIFLFGILVVLFKLFVLPHFK